MIVFLLVVTIIDVAKVVISDIDGTITKSDVRGMILPMIGDNILIFIHKPSPTKLLNRHCGLGSRGSYESFL